VSSPHSHLHPPIHDPHSSSPSASTIPPIHIPSSQLINRCQLPPRMILEEDSAPPKPQTKPQPKPQSKAPKYLPRKKGLQRVSRQVLSYHPMKMTRRNRLRRNGCRRGWQNGLVRLRNDDDEAERSLRVRMLVMVRFIYPIPSPFA